MGHDARREPGPQPFQEGVGGDKRRRRGMNKNTEAMRPTSTCPTTVISSISDESVDHRRLAYRSNVAIIKCGCSAMRTATIEYRQRSQTSSKP